MSQRFALHKPRGRIGERGQFAADIHGLVVCLDGQRGLDNRDDRRTGDGLAAFLAYLPVNHVGTSILFFDVCRGIARFLRSVFNRRALGSINDDAVGFTVVDTGVVLRRNNKRTSFDGITLFRRTGIVADKVDNKLVGFLLHGVIRTLDQLLVTVNDADVCLSGSSVVIAGISAVDTGDSNILFAQLLGIDGNISGEERLTVVDQINRAGAGLDEGNRGTSEGCVLGRHGHASGDGHGRRVTEGLAVKHRGVDGRRAGNLGNIGRLDVPAIIGNSSRSVTQHGAAAGLRLCTADYGFHRGQRLAAIHSQAASAAADQTACVGITGITQRGIIRCRNNARGRHVLQRAAHGTGDAARVGVLAEFCNAGNVLLIRRDITARCHAFHRADIGTGNAARGGILGCGHGDIALVGGILHHRARALRTNQTARVDHAHGGLIDHALALRRDGDRAIAVLDRHTAAARHDRTDVNGLIVVRIRDNGHATLDVQVLHRRARGIAHNADERGLLLRKGFRIDVQGHGMALAVDRAAERDCLRAEADGVHIRECEVLRDLHIGRCQRDRLGRRIRAGKASAEHGGLRRLVALNGLDKVHVLLRVGDHVGVVRGLERIRVLHQILVMGQVVVQLGAVRVEQVGGLGAVAVHHVALHAEEVGLFACHGDLELFARDRRGIIRELPASVFCPGRHNLIAAFQDSALGQAADRAIRAEDRTGATVLGVNRAGAGAVGHRQRRNCRTDNTGRRVGGLRLARDVARIHAIRECHFRVICLTADTGSARAALAELRGAVSHDLTGVGAVRKGRSCTDNAANTTGKTVALRQGRVAAFQRQRLTGLDLTGILAIRHDHCAG